VIRVEQCASFIIDSLNDRLISECSQMTVTWISGQGLDDAVPAVVWAFEYKYELVYVTCDYADIY